MKSVFTLFLLCFSFLSFCQTGKLHLDIVITDTVKPYFLDIYVHKKDSLVSKTTVLTSGTYLLNDFEPGNYNLEVYSSHSITRRLYIDSVNIMRDSVTGLKITYPPPCAFIYPANYKPVCPNNHTDKIVRIVYGYPSVKTMERAKKGQVYLGGCIISDCDPKYYCTIHKKRL